jgi:hypothetical protein
MDHLAQNHLPSRPADLLRPALAARDEYQDGEAFDAVASYAERITAAWQKAVASIIETGRLLNQAKDDDLPHGAFLAMVRKLPFRSRTAERLMKIAKHPALSNPTHVSTLPACWGTLYELSRIDAEDMRRLVARGKIHADMTRQEAIVLTKPDSGHDYYTPDAVTAASRQAMGGLDLDPASCPLANDGDADHAGVQAARYFTRDQDGLTKKWFGRVWCNPPFGDWKQWVPKILAEVDSGRVQQICVLMPARSISDTYPYQLTKTADAILVPDGRIQFWGPRAASGDPDASHPLIYIGHRRREFKRAFAEFGCVFFGDTDDVSQRVCKGINGA